MMRITLDDEQTAAVAKMVAEPTRAALNGSLYGTGKTVVTVEVAAGLNAKRVLIIAPLFTRLSWKNTILRQYPGTNVQIIDSKVAGKRALADLLEGVEGWYVIGREYFAAKAEQILKIQNTLDFVAYDECQKWANRKSKGWSIMRRLNKVGYKMALSATPAGNKFDNLFTITQWLWPNLEGHHSYWTFVYAHCETEFDPFASVVVKGEKNPGHFVKSLPCYVRLMKDFGEPIETTIDVALSPRERSIYDKFEKNLIVFLNENPLIAKVPVVKRLRLRQMSLGEVDVTDDGEVYFPENMKSTKYDTLRELLDGLDEAALVFTHSQKYAAVVAARLRQDGFRAVEWSGAVSTSKRDDIKEQFLAGEVDYIVATPGSIGEGTDGLQHRARLMVWLSRDENNMLNEQAFRRLYRRGQERQVISIDIAAEDTYDSGQLSDLIQQTMRMNRSLNT